MFFSWLCSFRKISLHLTSTYLLPTYLLYYLTYYLSTYNNNNNNLLTP